MTAVSHITNKSIKNDRIPNILCLFYDGFFEKDLCQIPCEIYGYKDVSLKRWECLPDYHPSNLHTIANNEFNIMGNDVIFDFIICNDRVNQYKKAIEIFGVLHIPILMVDHFSYTGELNPAHITEIEEKTMASKFIACNKHIEKSWGNLHTLIPYGIEINNDAKNKDIDCLIVGDFREDQTPLIKNLKDKLNATVVGLNKDLSEPVSTYEELKSVFRRSKIFINLATNTGLSRELLLAMQYECAIISNSTDTISSILQDNHNAIIINDLDQIISKCQFLLSRNDIRKKFADINREIIRTEFPMDNFIKKWTEVINYMKDKVAIYEQR